MIGSPSMGPRLVNRGNGHDEEYVRGVLSGPSMGPRLVNRGNPLPPQSGLYFQVLQWGRDQLIAEMNQRLSQLGAAADLQWGRDQLIAEMLSEPNHIMQIIVTFNGAAIS